MPDTHHPGGPPAPQPHPSPPFHPPTIPQQPSNIKATSGGQATQKFSDPIASYRWEGPYTSLEIAAAARAWLPGVPAAAATLAGADSPVRGRGTGDPPTGFSPQQRQQQQQQQQQPRLPHIVLGQQDQV